MSIDVPDYDKSFTIRPISSRRLSGRVILVDTFENYTSVVTEKWLQENGTIALATDYPKEGKSCMEITPATGEYAQAAFNIGISTKARMGLEFEFQCQDTIDNVEAISLSFWFYDNDGNEQEAGIRWLGVSGKKWQYWDENGAWQDLTDADEVSDAVQDIWVGVTRQPMYHNIKIILDFITKKYVALYCDGREYDISDLNLQYVANTDAPHVGFLITYDLIDGKDGSLRVDNVVLTDGEL